MMRRGRGGFTLMELVVSILITGVVAAMGYGAFSSIIDQRAMIRQAMVETENAAALRATLQEWLNRGGVVPDRGPLPSTTDRAPTSPSSRDMLTVLTRAPTTPSRAVATLVRLFVDDDPATPERGLTMRYIAVSTSGDLSPAQAMMDANHSQQEALRNQGTDLFGQAQIIHLPVTRELQPMVTGLRVEFLDRMTRRWYRSREVATIHPVAVRVTLEGARSAPLPPLLQLSFVKVFNDSL